MRTPSIAAAVAAAAVAVAAVFAGAACNPLDDKTIAFGHLRGIDAKLAAVIEVPITNALDQFAGANKLKVVRPAGDACATDACDLQRAKEAKAGAALIAEAGGGGLTVRLLDVKKESVIAEEKI